MLKNFRNLYLISFKSVTISSSRQLSNTRLLCSNLIASVNKDNVEMKADLKEKNFSLNYRVLDKNLSFHKEYPYVWLRDCCKCPKCFNRATEENETSPANLDLNMVPIKKKVADETRLEVTWHDGHESEYDIGELVRYGLKYEIKKKMPTENQAILWNKKSLPYPKGFREFDYKLFTSEDQAVTEGIKEILKYGAIIVKNTPANTDEIVKVCERIAPIQGSLYSPKNCIVTSNLEFADRAYTSMALKAHTDNAYIKNTAGLEAFHVVLRPKEGGQSIIIDGFNCAELLRKHYPDDFNFLARTYVEAEYLKSGKHHLKSRARIIELDEIHDTFFQIRHNIYNKVNLNHLSSENIIRFYRAMQRLLSFIDNEENIMRIDLQPDQVLIFDNFRLMHARTAVNGKRTLVTTYMPYDEWLSNARLRNLTDL